MILALLLASSILIALSFPPYQLPHLIWIGLIPWFYVLSKLAKASASAHAYRKAAALKGLTLSVLIGFTIFQWVAYAVHEYGMLPWPLAILILLGFGIVGQPQYIFVSLLSYRIFKDSNAAIESKAGKTRLRLKHSLELALLYTAIDTVLPKIFLDTQGHAFSSALYILQWAEIFGAHGLTFLAVFVNAWILFSLQELNFKLNRKQWSLELSKKLAPLGGLALVLLSYGMFRIDYIRDNTERDPGLSQTPLTVIQANIGDLDKLSSERGIKDAIAKVLATYFELSQKALEGPVKPAALIWPETAFPGAFRSGLSVQEREQERELEDFVTKSGVPLLFGGYDHKRSVDGGQDYNAFFLLSTTLVHETYHKSVLLPFGEYIPYLENFEGVYRWFRNQFPQMGFFGRGPGPQALRLPDLAQEVRVSPLICYEALFPEYSREGVKKGAQILLNITNDSWFGPWGEPHLHLSQSIFRSVETRTPQLRATNTGFSALILPSGEVRGQSQLFVPEVLPYLIPTRPAGTAPPWTPLQAFGDWFGKICVAILVIKIGIEALRRSGYTKLKKNNP